MLCCSRNVVVVVLWWDVVFDGAEESRRGGPKQWCRWHHDEMVSRLCFDEVPAVRMQYEMPEACSIWDQR